MIQFAVGAQKIYNHLMSLETAKTASSVPLFLDIYLIFDANS